MSHSLFSTADKSLKSYPDGSFFDFGRGGLYYKDRNELEKSRPDLKNYTPKEATDNTASQSQRRKQVTQQFTQAKEKSDLAEHLANAYVPFFDIDKCLSNIGVYDNKLAVSLWTPTKGGASRGTHYSFAQYRADTEYAKWMSLKGSDSKSFEARIVNENTVYGVFGMGDFLVMKSTNLNFIAFGGDGSIKNNHYAELIKSKIGNRLVVVIGDNDKSGQSTLEGFIQLKLNAVLFPWPPSAPEKVDVRDIANVIKEQDGDIYDLESYLTSKAAS